MTNHARNAAMFVITEKGYGSTCISLCENKRMTVRIESNSKQTYVVETPITATHQNVAPAPLSSSSVLNCDSTVNTKIYASCSATRITTIEPGGGAYGRCRPHHRPLTGPNSSQRPCLRTSTKPVRSGNHPSNAVLDQMAQSSADIPTPLGLPAVPPAAG